MGKNKRKKGGGPRLRKDVRPPEPAVPKKRSRFYIWIVLGICLVSFFVHLQGADYIRRQGMLTFDESIYARLGFQLKSGGPYNTQAIYAQQMKLGRKLPAYVNDPVFHHPPFFPWLVSLSYYLLPQQGSYTLEDLYTMAVKVSNLAGCALILLTFFFGRRLYNPEVGLLGAVLMALEFNLLMCSTKLWIDGTLALMMWLTLYALWLSCRNKYFFYAAGVGAGLALLTKYTAVLIFPVFISYALLYERPVFRQKEFYFFILISGGILLPWIFHNISSSGPGGGLFHQVIASGYYRSRIAEWLRLSAGPMLGAVAVFFLWRYVFRRKEREGYRSNWRWLGTALAAFLFGYLLVQKPFLVSLGKSLAWPVSVLTGWKIGLFDDQPKYFYLKQHLEYSFLYFIFFIAFVDAFRRGKEDAFLAIAAFWVLLFGIFWKNFQGRYVLGFTPAAMMLVAVSLWRYGLWLWKKPQVYMRVLFGLSCLFFLYVLLKTWRVDYAYALNDSVAYF